MERDNIIQGRDVLTQYRQAHELLHQESLDPAQMAKRHEILETALRTSFEELGFTSAEEFYTQEEELGQIEYDESLRAMQLRANSGLAGPAITSSPASATTGASAAPSAPIESDDEYWI